MVSGGPSVARTDNPDRSVDVASCCGAVARAGVARVRRGGVTPPADGRPARRDGCADRPRGCGGTDYPPDPVAELLGAPLVLGWLVVLGSPCPLGVLLLEALPLLPA